MASPSGKRTAWLPVGVHREFAWWGLGRPKGRESCGLSRSSRCLDFVQVRSWLPLCNTRVSFGGGLGRREGRVSPCWVYYAIAISHGTLGTGRVVALCHWSGPRNARGTGPFGIRSHRPTPWELGGGSVACFGSVLGRGIARGRALSAVVCFFGLLLWRADSPVGPEPTWGV